MWKKIGKRPRLALVLAIAVAAAIGLIWQKLREPPPQIITLPNGEQFRFAGVTWGTNHVFGSMAGRLVNGLPRPVANFVWQHARTLLGQVNYYHYEQPSEPTLCVWFQPMGTNALSAGRRSITTIFSKLADEHDEEAGAQGRTYMQDILWPFGGLSVVPRRSPVLQLRLYQSNPKGGISNEIGRVRFANPLYGRFPQWKPEPLPAVKKAGDLEVRLEKIMTGVVEFGGQTRKYHPAQGGENAVTLFDAMIHSPRGTNEQWIIQSAQLSDATGNVLQRFEGIIDYLGRPAQLSDATGKVLPGLFYEYGYRHAITGTLWPDEAAWRLRLELKRTRGYAPGETVTFRNVPVPKVGTTNLTPMTGFAGGMKLVLTEFERKPDITINAMGIGYMASRIRVELPTHPDGVALDFVEITTDTREKPVTCGETSVESV